MNKEKKQPEQGSEVQGSEKTSCGIGTRIKEGSTLNYEETKRMLKKCL